MRNNGYYNGEGYYDPTAGAALANIEREERRNRKPRVYRAPYRPRETPGSKSQTHPRCDAIHFFDTTGGGTKNKAK